MTIQDVESRTDPLAPLLEAVQAHAQRDADLAVRAGDADAAASLAGAEAESAALVDDARRRGTADAELILSTERARGAREARAIVLDAQRRAYESLRQAARDAVCGLREEPLYPALLEALRARIAAELGPAARSREVPRGGLIGETGGRRTEYTLDGLADDIVERLRPEMERLWTP